MSQTLNLAQEIFSRYGTIKRARGCFLYTAKGVRLTDLYQQGGRAILGWGGSVFTVFKNVLERGITGSYFTDFSVRRGDTKSQLSRAVEELFNSERTAFVFHTKSAALEAALSLSAGDVSVYRPWNPVAIDWQSVDCIVFEPTLPWTSDIFILAAKDSVVEQCRNHRDGDSADETVSSEKMSLSGVSRQSFPNESVLASPLAAAVTRSIYDLIKALQVREEKHFFIYDQIITKYWERKGPYLFPKIPENQYADFVLHCLDYALVISPGYHQPSIVPFGADKGNFTKLKNNPFVFEPSDSENSQKGKNQA